MAFFLESTFVGLFFFGWSRLSKKKHLLVTFLMALGSNLSALWILIANAWMQYPIGSDFNFLTMRMETTDFWSVVTSPWAQAKFMHTINAGYMTGAIFVLAISAFYLIRGRDIAFAKRSIKVAAVFGLMATIFTLHMGDESGYLVAQNQPTKIAAMEAAWETHEAPAPLSLFAIPTEAERKNDYEISVPWLFGLMGTRSTSQEIPGINPLVETAQERIIEGAQAVELLTALRKAPGDQDLQKRFNEVRKSLGYGLLLKKYTSDISQATPEQMRQAALSTIPAVTPMYWSFRLRVACSALWSFYSRPSALLKTPSHAVRDFYASCFLPFRFRGLPVSSVGSWPNTVVNLGASTKCCPLTYRSLLFRQPIWCFPSADSSFCTRPCLSSTCG